MYATSFIVFSFLPLVVSAL